MEDLISQLPDHLLHQILLELPTKTSVTTSVLSTRWRYVWLRVPGLDINYIDFRYDLSLKCLFDKFVDLNKNSLINNMKLKFVSLKKWINSVVSCGVQHPGLDIDSNDFREDRLECFVNMFLDLDEKSPIYQLKIKYDDRYIMEEFNLEKWINSVITRGVHHLVVDAYSNTCYGSSNYKPIVPVSIFKCETLVHLNLDYVYLPNFKLVSLPCLETMHLRFVYFPSDAALESLISSSRVLRVLDIGVIDNVKVFRVRSRTLRSLKIRFKKYWSRKKDQTHEVVIDAPRLKCLCLERDKLVNLVLNTLCSPVKLVIDLSTIQNMSNFLAGMSKVTSLALSCSTLTAMYAYLRPLPRLAYLTHLQVTFRSSIPKLFLRFLACYPNLKSLDLVMRCCGSLYMLEISDSAVPKCLLTSIESVDIKCRTEKYQAETKLFEYILGNAALLKKLTVKLHGSSKEEKYQAAKQIVMFPRRSSVCQVYVD